MLLSRATAVTTLTAYSTPHKDRQTPAGMADRLGQSPIHPRPDQGFDPARAHLEETRKRLEASMDRKEGAVHDRLVAIGHPQCHDLCESMYDKLPREVRDMVYC